MNSSQVLKSLKNVFPSLHHPLPLSRVERQRLLTALKSSFRQNLDKEHGWAPEDPAASAKKHPQATSDYDAHRRPTDRHLRAVLSNPLFSHGGPTASILAGSPSPRDPMEVFDEAVAKGLMTQKIATGCLRSKRNQMLLSSALSIHEAMTPAQKSAGTAIRVVQWLRSSGQERELAFLDNHRLVSALVPYMLVEGMEELIWQWAERVLRGGGSPANRPHAVGVLIHRLALAKMETADGANLDETYNTVLRADKILQAEDRPLVLSGMWMLASRASTVDAWKRPPPSQALFESFVEVADHLNKRLVLDRAHLDLHHPTQPSHHKALRFLRSDDWTVQALRRSLDPAGPNKHTHAKDKVARIVSMGMDAVKHLTQIGQSDEAESVLELIGGVIIQDDFLSHQQGALARQMISEEQHQHDR